MDRTTLLVTPQAGKTRRSLDEINPLCSNPNCRGNYLPVPILAGLHADKMNDDHHAPCLREVQALCVLLVSVLALQLRHRVPIVEICHNRPLKRKKVCHWWKYRLRKVSGITHPYRDKISPAPNKGSSLRITLHFTQFSSMAWPSIGLKGEQEKQNPL